MFVNFKHIVCYAVVHKTCFSVFQSKLVPLERCVFNIDERKPVFTFESILNFNFSDDDLDGCDGTIVSPTSSERGGGQWKLSSLLDFYLRCCYWSYFLFTLLLLIKISNWEKILRRVSSFVISPTTTFSLSIFYSLSEFVRNCILYLSADQFPLKFHFHTNFVKNMTNSVL